MDQTTQPQHAGEPLSPLLRQILARTADEDSYRRWERQVATTGYCSHPVRLTGGFDAADRRTGEVRPVFTTEGEPDGVLLKACGNRRASRCRSCSAVKGLGSSYADAAFPRAVRLKQCSPRR